MKPKIVTICGSSRFIVALYKAYIDEIKKGNVVLTYLPSRDSFDRSAWHNEKEIKIALDKAHLCRIDISDEVLILNKDGYIGKSTQNELNYAISQRKVVRYLEPDKILK